MAAAITEREILQRLCKNRVISVGVQIDKQKSNS